MHDSTINSNWFNKITDSKSPLKSLSGVVFNMVGIVSSVSLFTLLLQVGLFMNRINADSLLPNTTTSTHVWMSNSLVNNKEWRLTNF